MSGKRPRPNDDSSGSDSEPNLTTFPPIIPMDSDRSDTAADPRSSPTTASGTDLGPSSSRTRNTDPGMKPTTSGPDTEPFLHSGGSYVVITPKDESVSFRRINIFWPAKYLHSICGGVEMEIETPANGSLIVRTQSRAQTKALLKIDSFCEKPVTVALHSSRNTTKGTIFAPEMRFMTEDEILDGLRYEGVSHVRRLTSFKDGQRRDTSLLVITFDTNILPKTLLAGHIRYEVRVFVPNPLRCFSCQRFGHSSKFCKQTPRCQKCGEAPHGDSDCSAPVKCLSCNSTEHDTNSNKCPVWKHEKEICAEKATKGVSYQQARRTVEQRNPTPGNKSYAQAAKKQTTTSETQTDPLPQLPPLKLLSPVDTEPTPSTQTSTSTDTADLDPNHAEPQPSMDAPSPQATARSGAWQTARGRGRAGPAGPSRPAAISPQFHSPALERTERQGRPADRVSTGRNRSQSQSIGRYLSRGGDFSQT